ncbi:MAG: DUF1285 domain-containing protein [Litoreibacter sp.]|uniref:DUF1285 domain-containing protein n=1 Tax=Litoreibacter sp. TaxID=1969459 RepID=UPI00329A7787
MAKGTDAQKLELPSAESIAAAAQEGAKGGMPPVDKWNPPFCGDLDMRIARDGTWFYLGTPIGRAGLVKLFSSIIRKDGDDYFLVTPVEKVGITVDDAPFVAIDFDASGAGADQKLRFETHVGDSFVAGVEHPLRVSYDEHGEPSPYVLVRRNLEALVDRKSFYRLVDLGTHHNDWFGVWSSGEFFPIIRSSELGD